MDRKARGNCAECQLPGDSMGPDDVSLEIDVSVELPMADVISRPGPQPAFGTLVDEAGEPPLPRPRKVGRTMTPISRNHVVRANAGKVSAAMSKTAGHRCPQDERPGDAVRRPHLVTHSELADADPCSTRRPEPTIGALVDLRPKAFAQPGVGGIHGLVPDSSRPWLADRLGNACPDFAEHAPCAGGRPRTRPYGTTRCTGLPEIDTCQVVVSLPPPGVS